MPYADLHVHTTRSDGSLALEAVPDAARRGGVDVVAVTDHDRVQPFDGPIVERDGVTLVHGIELRVETTGGQRIDLLGYGLEPSAGLEAILERIQENRIERGRAIADCVESRLGVDLDVTIDGGFGRPHIARAIDAHPRPSTTIRARSIVLSGLAVRVMSLETSRRSNGGQAALAESCRLVSLAHPLRYRDPRVHSPMRPNSTPSNCTTLRPRGRPRSPSSERSSATTCSRPAAATPTMSVSASTGSLGGPTSGSSCQPSNPNVDR